MKYIENFVFKVNTRKGLRWGRKGFLLLCGRSGFGTRVRSRGHVERTKTLSEGNYETLK